MVMEHAIDFIAIAMQKAVVSLTMQVNIGLLGQEKIDGVLLDPFEAKSAVFEFIVI